MNRRGFVGALLGGLAALKLPRLRRRVPAAAPPTPPATVVSVAYIYKHHYDADAIASIAVRPFPYLFVETENPLAGFEDWPITEKNS